MGYQIRAAARPAVWALARKQHGVVARRQLLELGVHPQAIKHRVAAGRLHPVHRGVYAIGRPGLTQEGRWMAAVLACGPAACLSDGSAAALWGIRGPAQGPIEVSVRGRSGRRRPGIRIHLRQHLGPEDIRMHRGIPVTSPVRTLVDLGGSLQPAALEAAVNEADRLDLIDPERLREAIERHAGEVGVRRLRSVLDRHTYRFSESALERRFLSLLRDSDLPIPETQSQVNGYRVDFHWPDFGLIVETDGLRYHRTPARQARDRRRDQVHAAAGMTQLRFSHAQVANQPEVVVATLTAVFDRLRQSRVADMTEPAREGGAGPGA